MNSEVQSGQGYKAPGEQGLCLFGNKGQGFSSVGRKDMGHVVEEKGVSSHLGFKIQARALSLAFLQEELQMATKHVKFASALFSLGK